MILVDYSHTQMRMLYVAISQSYPKKVDGKFKTDDFFPMFKHLMLNSLRLIHNKFGAKYGEIVLCIDARSYWRKDIYPDYKGKRKAERDKTDVNFEEFFEKAAVFLETLDNYFPYKVLRVEKAEADDMFGVIAKKYGPTQPVLGITSDKDMKQCIGYGATIYDPIKTEFVRISPEELKAWKIEHILCGDEGDGVPHIKRMTQFTDTFIAYLKENGIHIKDVKEFNALDISKKLYSEFDIYKKNKNGELLNEKDIFKATPFGPAGAKKFAANLAENLKADPLLAKHFARNKELVLFDSIPEEMVNSIINEFNSLEMKYDANEISNYLMQNSMMELVKNITDFYITPQAQNDWF